MSERETSSAFKISANSSSIDKSRYEEHNKENIENDKYLSQG